MRGGSKVRLPEGLRLRILTNNTSQGCFVTDTDEDRRVYIAVLIESMTTLTHFVRTYVSLVPFSTVVKVLDTDKIANDVAYTLKQFDAPIIPHKFILRVNDGVEKSIKKMLKNDTVPGRNETIYDRSFVYHSSNFIR